MTTFDFTVTRIRPLSEEVFDEIVQAAGGTRAHPDHASRDVRGADYVLGRAVIELKILDDEGLSKLDRQEKLAKLFVPLAPTRPVHVLDRELLDIDGQRAYDRALEGPIKGAVKSAKGQLVQSRLEYPDTNRSILWLVNNGNTALDHDEIVQMVTRRARNDTKDIDGVVVAGAYLHSDGYEAIALWPINYIEIKESADFPEFERLRAAFNSYAEKAMTASLISGRDEAMSKGPILDSEFEFNGTTFVKPAPPLGSQSEFWVRGRPRLNSTGIETCPPVAVVFPDMDRVEWERFHVFLPHESGFGASHAEWLKERETAVGQGAPLRPLVPMSITLEGWLGSLKGTMPDDAFASIATYATALFHTRMRELIDGAMDVAEAGERPSRCIVAATQEIGQDEANDLSSILLVEDMADGQSEVTELVSEVRIFHRHACALAAAYAIRDQAKALFWEKDKTYAWA